MSIPPRMRFHFLVGLLPHFAMVSLLVACLLLLLGLSLGLWVAPADYQQGESYRIMFVHVPAASLSLIVYVVMASFAVVAFVFKHPIAERGILANAAVGASFAFLALMTGAIWGKPMWGAWWVWDARLTAELILFFLYLGVLALGNAIEDPKKAAQASGILAVVGLINLPIIHYSVVWWNTLHQGSTVGNKQALHESMVQPLLAMEFSFLMFYIAILCWNLYVACVNILQEESPSST